jgi:hypothetical protein
MLSELTEGESTRSNCGQLHSHNNSDYVTLEQACGERGCGELIRIVGKWNMPARGGEVTWGRWRQVLCGCVQDSVQRMRITRLAPIMRLALFLY